MFQVNYLSVILAAAFIIPVLYGLFSPVTKPRLQYFIGSLFDSVEFFTALALSFYLTGKIFFQSGLESQSNIYGKIYSYIPSEIKIILQAQGLMTYLFAVPVILLILLVLIRLITTPVYKLAIEPVTGLFYDLVDSLGILGRALLGALWRLPKAICFVLLIGLGVNFYSYYFYNPVLTKMINQSPIYQALYNKAIYPVINSNIAKNIPVIVNNSFDKINSNDGSGGNSAESLIKQLSGKIRVVEYFNGVTLDEAIKSNEEIDNTARQIVGYEKNNIKKAYLLYKWVSQNIKYDTLKAETLGKNPEGMTSGSIIAFNTGKGVCFDYSSLYISMCRAVGLKVRLVTGLGYSGISWGDHAWNQVYAPEEERWINVDTTFGASANYFDKQDFNLDHKFDEIQGEW